MIIKGHPSGFQAGNCLIVLLVFMFLVGNGLMLGHMLLGLVLNKQIFLWLRISYPVSPQV